MRKIEGSNYGLHCQGLYDPAFMLLHKLVYRVERDYGKKYDQLLKVLRESRLEQHILTIMVNLNSKVDLSPKGLISLMLLVFNLMSKEIGDEFAQ